MKTLMMGAALAVLFSVAPALAKTTTKTMGSEAGTHSATLDENATRHRNADGTYQGMPVVQGPAHWSSAASSGASSGESGSDMHKSAK